MPAWPFLSVALLLAAGTPEERAVDYLVREVPRWPRENQCFSCHNNGDAARALYLARQRGYTVPAEALAGTSEWLGQPGKWDDNRGNPAFTDKQLARVQFAAALAEAVSTGAFPAGQALLAAADTLVREQSPDGSWKIDTGGAPGAPATYGTPLATYMSRRVLETAGRERFSVPIARANRWLESTAPVRILDAAVQLLALPRSEAVRRQSIPYLVKNQTSDGGWGPQPKAPAEPFDTAVVLLALDAAGETPPIARGRAFLISQQQSSGGWPETTRPAGLQSYAEHMSTSGWATYALLATDPKRH